MDPTDKDHSLKKNLQTHAFFHQIAPQLIYCSISGFGSDGPYKKRAGYDVIAASLGGLMHITGPEVNHNWAWAITLIITNLGFIKVSQNIQK